MTNISVIIPVYNTQPKYLKVAIESVLNQSQKGIEIIIVNDGSTNADILDYLGSLDNKQIKIINQTNQGLSGARNTGLKYASGKFVGFLDSDDWLDKNFYKILYVLCTKNKCDIACGKLTSAHGDGTTQDIDVFNNAIKNDLSEIITYIKHGSVCSKLFNAQLFNNVQFPEKLYYEDNITLVTLLIKAKKVAFSNSVRYYYRKNPQSIVGDYKHKQKLLDDSVVILKQIKEISDKYTPKHTDLFMYCFMDVLFNKHEFYYNRKYRNKILKEFPKYVQHIRYKWILKNVFSIIRYHNLKYLVIFGMHIPTKKN